jgi:hypothetical protein
MTKLEKLKGELAAWKEKYVTLPVRINFLGWIENNFTPLELMLALDGEIGIETFYQAYLQAVYGPTDEDMEDKE